MPKRIQSVFADPLRFNNSSKAFFIVSIFESSNSEASPPSEQQFARRACNQNTQPLASSALYVYRYSCFKLPSCLWSSCLPLSVVMLYIRSSCDIYHCAPFQMFLLGTGPHKQRKRPGEAVVFFCLPFLAPWAEVLSAAAGRFISNQPERDTSKLQPHIGERAKPLLGTGQKKAAQNQHA